MCKKGECWAVAGPSSQPELANTPPEKDNSPWNLSNANPALFGDCYRNADIHEIPTDFKDEYSAHPYATGGAKRRDSGYESSKGKGKKKDTICRNEHVEHFDSDRYMFRRIGEATRPVLKTKDVQYPCPGYNLSNGKSKALYPDQGYSPVLPGLYTSKFREHVDDVGERTQGKNPEEDATGNQTAKSGIPLRFTRDLPESMGIADLTKALDETTLREPARCRARANTKAEIVVNPTPKRVSPATFSECPPTKAQPKSIRKKLQERHRKTKANLIRRLRRGSIQIGPSRVGASS